MQNAESSSVKTILALTVEMKSNVAVVVHAPTGCALNVTITMNAQGQLHIARTTLVLNVFQIKNVPIKCVHMGNVQNVKLIMNARKTTSVFAIKRQDLAPYAYQTMNVLEGLSVASMRLLLSVVSKYCFDRRGFRILHL